MKVATVANTIGKGLVAGLAGTAAMTVSSTIEAKLRGRAPSTAPARAAEKVLGIEKFGNHGAEERFSNLVHWGYGTGWGVVRGMLRTVGLGSKAATGAHFGSLWGSELVMLPTLGVTPPFTVWGGKEVAIDAWHHAVYVAATAAAYEMLD